MESPKKQVVTEAARIRGLAHPLRLRLLSLLDDEGEATATRCAQVTGESVASCAFHLGMLGKYGFAERAEARGRERPWRAVSRSRTLRYDPAEPGSARATGELAGLVVDEQADRLRRWLAAADEEEPAWVLASTLATASFWATQDELHELSRQVEALAERFTGRWADPSQRPPGSRPARLFAAVNPETSKPEPASPDASEQSA
jgi:hypothetical protein